MPRQPQTLDKYIVRLPDGLRDRIQAMARSQNDTMNATIVRVLETAVNRHEQENGSATPYSRAKMAMDGIFENSMDLQEALAELGKEQGQEFGDSNT